MNFTPTFSTQKNSIMRHLYYDSTKIEEIYCVNLKGQRYNNPPELISTHCDSTGMHDQKIQLY